MAPLGAHPRLAAMMLAAATPGEAALAADLAALLEERDPLRSPDAPADIALRLAAIADGDPGRPIGARCPASAAPPAQYRRRLRLAAATSARTAIPAGCSPPPSPTASPSAAASPAAFRLSGGGGARLPRTDPLANAPLLAVAALEMKASARIRLAAPLDPDALPPALAARVTEQVEAGFDPVTGAVLARRRRRLGALMLTDRTEPADPAEVAAALAAPWPPTGCGRCPGPTDAAAPGARGADARHRAGRGWPDLSDAALIADDRRTGCRRICRHCRDSPICQRLDLPAILRGLLPWELAARLDRDAADASRAARRRAPRSTTPQPVPLASARAQAFYGLATTPRSPAAASRCSLRCCRRPAGRSRSPRTWRVSGAAPGPTRGGTCAGAIPSTTGRRTDGGSDLDPRAKTGHADSCCRGKSALPSALDCA